MAFPDTVTLDFRLKDDILYFDGTLDHINMGNIALTDDVTIEAWVKVEKHVLGQGYRVFVADLPPGEDVVLVASVDTIGGPNDNGTLFFVRTNVGFRFCDGPKLEQNVWTHLAGSFNETTGDLKIYVNSVLKNTVNVSGETLVHPSEATSGIGANADGFSSNLKGFVRDVRVWSDVRTPAEIAANMDIELVGSEAGLLHYWKIDEGSGSTATDSAGSNDGTITGAEWITAGGPFWTDVLADVRRREGIRNRYGILGQEETDRVGGTGSMEFWLKNDANNSGGLEGYYSPDHANARTGFEIGIETRLRLTEGATSYVKHRGRVNLIDPEPGVKRTRRTKVQSLDWMAATALHKMNLLALGKNVRSDVFLGNIIDNVAMGPVKRSLAVGQETFAYAGDDLRDERVTAFAGLNRVTLSEFGFGFVIGDTEQGGLFKWQDRHARVKDTTVQKTFVQADLIAMKAPRSERNIRNRVEAITFPREVGASPEVLYTLQTTIQINPTETRTIKGKFSDPSNRDARISGDNMITPLKGTDYQFSSSPSGSGDLDDNLTITATYGATTVEYVLTNSGGTTGHITILQARGDAIRIYDPVESTAEDAQSQSDHFMRTERLRLSYQDDPLVGQDFADNILSRRKDPKTRLETFSIPGHRSQAMLDAGLTLEPGDRIDVSESISAIGEEFFINGVEMFLQPTPNGAAITWTYWVTPASTEAFWLLGTVGSSELGTTTKLGF